MGRLQFYWDYLGSFRKSLVAWFVFMSNISWLPERARNWLYHFIPAWRWQTWLLIGALLLVAFVLEEAHYRNLIEKSGKKSSAKPAQSFLVPIVSIVTIAILWTLSVALQHHRMTAATVPQNQRVASNTNHAPTQLGPNIAHITLDAPNGGWLITWGELTPNTLHAVIRLDTILPYRHYFNLLMVYRVSDTAVDGYKDTNIIKSALFSIPNQPELTIDVIPNKKEKMVYERWMGKRAAFYNVPMQANLIVLPSDIKAGQISNLADAVNLGGRVVATGSFDLILINEKLGFKQRLRP